MDEGLIDRIYECAFAPDAWPGVLGDISQAIEARGGCVMTVNSTVLNWTASARMIEVWEAMERRGLMVCGDRFRRLVAVRHSGFLTDQDGYSDEAEMAADPLYRDILWPMGLGWATATTIPIPTGDTLVVSFERDRDRGPIEPAVVAHLDALRPHLARSALISARLQMERARATSETLAALGIPALVFDLDGRVLAANGLIEAMAGPVRWRARDRVSLTDPAADALFQQAVANIAAAVGDEPGQVRSFAVRAGGDRAALVAHVTPVRGLVRDLFVRCAGVLILTPVALPQAPPVELVQSLFDLTPAEARIARRLSAGDTVDEIALAGGVSPTTVRNQVRGVLEKTGCRRQAEVVALLGGFLNIH